MQQQLQQNIFNNLVQPVFLVIINFLVKVNC